MRDAWQRFGRVGWGVIFGQIGSFLLLLLLPLLLGLCMQKWLEWVMEL